MKLVLILQYKIKKEMQNEGQEAIRLVGNKNEQDQNQPEHKTLNHNSLYYTFMERYFTSYENQYQYLHLHSNGICLISLKKEALPSPPKQIKDFIEVSEVKGKKKKGGIKVRPETHIARILCQDGSVFPVLALIEGIILQKNQNLNIDSMGRRQGYFIIILPSKKIVPQKFGMTRVIIDHMGQ